jgi:hypothetical protein
MPKLSISPFRTLNENYAGIDTEESKTTGEALREGDYINKYSCDTNLNIRSVCSINSPQLFNEIGLGKDTKLQLIVRGKSATTRYNTYKESDFFDGNSAKEIEIFLEIPAGKIADELEIEYSLYVFTSGSKNDEFAPKDKASIIWKASRKFLLEGHGAMFPTTIEDFTESQGGKNAAWRIDWKKTSLHGSPSRVRLILNGLNASFVNRVNPEDGTDPNEASSQILYYGVAVALLEYASKIDNATKLTNEKFEAGTLGSYLINFLNIYLKTRTGEADIGGILKKFRDEPETVKSILQSNLILSALHD